MKTNELKDFHHIDGSYGFCEVGKVISSKKIKYVKKEIKAWNPPKEEDFSGKKEFHEFDENGKIIHEKESFKETWYEYDAKGNLIHTKAISFLLKITTLTTDRWFEYDEKGRLRHEKKCDNYEKWTKHYEQCIEHYEKWTEYEEDGRKSHTWDTEGYEEWTEHDAEGRVTHYRDTTGYEEWTEFTADKIKVHEKGGRYHEEFCDYNLDGFPIWQKIVYPTGHCEEFVYEYDSSGRTCTARCDESPMELTWKFDAQGNCIYFKDDRGGEHWLEYDEEGRQIYGKDPKDWENKEFEEWRCEFDEKGNLIYSKDPDGKTLKMTRVI